MSARRLNVVSETKNMRKRMKMNEIDDIGEDVVRRKLFSDGRRSGLTGFGFAMLYLMFKEDGTLFDRWSRAFFPEYCLEKARSGLARKTSRLDLGIRSHMCRNMGFDVSDCFRVLRKFVERNIEECLDRENPRTDDQKTSFLP